MNAAPVIVELSEDQAIVLFELLGRWRYADEPLAVKDRAEECALRVLINRLEYRVSDLLGPTYPNRVEEARARLRSARGMA